VSGTGSEGWLAICYRCGRYRDFPAPITQEAAWEWLDSHGWRRNPHGRLCPACAKKEKAIP